MTADLMPDPVRNPDDLIFSDTTYPGAARMTIFTNAWSVETYWDRKRGAWVTEIRDLKQRLRDREDLVLKGRPRVTRSVQQAKRNHERAIDLVVRDS